MAEKEVTRKMPKDVGLKVPKSLGACADLLFDIKSRRLELQHEVDALQEQETALSNYIIDTVPKGDTGASGKHHRVTIVPKIVVQVEDWDKFYAYIARTKAWELLQRRPGEKAIAERWDNGKEVPGIVPFQTVRVSLQKV